MSGIIEKMKMFSPSKRLLFAVSASGLLLLAACSGKSKAPAPTSAPAPTPVQPIVDAPDRVSAESKGVKASAKAQEGCAFEWTISGGLFAGGASIATGLEVQFRAGQIGKLKLECRARNTAGAESAPAIKSLDVVAAPIIESFSAEQNLVNQGAETRLTAVFRDGKAEIDGLGPVASGVSVPTGRLNAQKRFHLMVTNAAGTKTSRELVVNVVGGPSIAAFKAAKTMLTQGEGTTLWIEYSGGVGSIDGLGVVKSGTTISTGSLFESRSYTLKVDNGAGAVASQSLYLDVVALPAIEAFRAEKNPLNPGEGTRLIAQFRVGTGQIEGLGPVSSGVPIPTGSLNASKRFKLTVTNAAGAKAEGELAVDVVEKPVIQSFVAQKSLLKEGGETTLTARFSGGDGHIEGLGNVKSGIPISTGALKTNQTFKLRVTNAAGAEDFAHLDVAVAERPVIESFTVAPAIITEGDPVTLSYVFKGGTGKLAGMEGLPQGEVEGGSLELKPLKSGSCILTVSNALGETDTANVNFSVVPAPVIRSFTSKGLVNRGQSATLVADFEHGTGAIDQGIEDIQPGVIPTGPLDKLKLFTLTVTNAAGKSAQAHVLAGPPEQKKVAAGKYHALHVKPDGSVWAWGGNESLQLGHQTRWKHSSKAIRVPKLPACVAVTAGSYCSMALDKTGRLWSWGSGPLGHGHESYVKDEPECIEGLRGIVAAAVSWDHSLALTEDGQVWAWGDNTHGQLGDDSIVNRLSPVRVQGLKDVVAIAAGPDFSLALRQDGVVWAWGRAVFEYDKNEGIDTRTPHPLSCPEKIVAIGANSTQHGISGTLFLQSDGKLLKPIWGWDLDASPVTEGLESLFVGSRHRVAWKQDGTVWIWGHLMDENGEWKESPPCEMEGLKGAVEVANSEYFSLVLKTDGSLLAWGNNDDFQLGNGDPVVQSEPQLIPGLENIQSMTAGYSLSAALDTQGQVWTWGDDGWGPLGECNKKNCSLPRPRPGLGTVSMIAAGHRHVLALKKDGSVWGWGLGSFGQLGELPLPNYYAGTPIKIKGLPDKTRAIAAFSNTSMALDENGDVWIWGRDAWAQVNADQQTDIRKPVKVSAMTEVTGIFGGFTRGYALQNGKTWGIKSDFSQPMEWSELKNIVSICAGNEEVALDDKGVVWNWYPFGGSAPKARMQGIRSLAMGREHGLALGEGGEIWAWGWNSSGNLGPVVYHSEIDNPVKVFEQKGLISAAAGDSHSFAITADRKVLAWGDDTFGQLGFGRMLWSAKPIEVQFSEEESAIGGDSPEASH